MEVAHNMCSMLIKFSAIRTVGVSAHAIRASSLTKTKGFRGAFAWKGGRK